MRLSNQEIAAFISAFSHFMLEGERVELRLYGSRTDDRLKGGDIDLLVVTESEKQRHEIAVHKAEILGKIYMQIDEQRIDITVANIKSAKVDPFVEMIFPGSVLLSEWG